ncbi:MAG TPA: serine hydrolase domain-containing protein [bacterium]|nr:serine hydrolase domain-containing protein [bacterium]
MRTTLTLILLFSLCAAGQEPPAPPTLAETITKSRDEGLFSAVQIAVFEKGDMTLELHDGFTSFEPKDEVTRYTLFDLASLTKPLGTLAMVGQLIAQKRLDPEEKATAILPGLLKPIRVIDLLSHTSGLPAYDAWYFKYRDIQTIEERKTAIVKYAAEFPKERPAQYSDLNYLLLGFLVERVTGATLDRFYADTLATIGYRGLPPIYLTDGIDLSAVAATSISPQTGILNHGNVEDENCQLIGGVCGHAGLFGTAEAVGQLLSHLLKIPWYRAFVEGGIGFDRPEPPESNFGLTATAGMRGHLGYTGTAFLIDLARDRIIVVLTNRTHPTADKPKMKERLRKFRQTIFDELLK